MMERRVGFFILVLALAGCSSPAVITATHSEPTAAVEIPTSLTQIPDLTETITPPPEPTATPTPAITPEPAAPQIPDQGTSAIIARVEGGVNSFLLVGGSQNGSWINAADVAAHDDLSSDYHIYTAFDSPGFAGGSEPTYEMICDQYFINLEPLPISQSALGITGSWDVLPRVPLELSTDLEVYLRAITAWQIEQAPSMPIPAINKIWKIDLEGDGVDEVFLNGTHYAEPTGHNVGPRDYSVVLMRKVIGSDVITVELVGDYYREEAENQFPLTYNLEFSGDLNGDGKMEVVVGVSRWEGSGVMVFEINGVEAQLVLSVMCSQ